MNYLVQIKVVLDGKTETWVQKFETLELAKESAMKMSENLPEGAEIVVFQNKESMN